MVSVADDLRARTRAQVLGLSAKERMALAFSLGDDDLALFMRTSGLPRSEALARLRAQRARGRSVASVAAAGRP